MSVDPHTAPNPMSVEQAIQRLKAMRQNLAGAPGRALRLDRRALDLVIAKLDSDDLQSSGAT